MSRKGGKVDPISEFFAKVVDSMIETGGEAARVDVSIPSSDNESAVMATFKVELHAYETKKNQTLH